MCLTPMIPQNLQNNDLPYCGPIRTFRGLWGGKKQYAFQWSQFAKVAVMWHFWAFLRIFCILNFDQDKGHQGLVSVIRVNGCMLPLS